MSHNRIVQRIETILAGGPKDYPTVDDTATAREPAVRLPLPFAEFITLMALLMCLTALSIDIMLPSLPDIAAALNVTDLSQLPLIISLYMGGLAVGQLFWGPLADKYGRRRPLLAGLVVFALASLVAATSQSFHFLIAARFLQGFAGAAGRIISMAVVRDLFAGRQMARVMSTIMMVFILVPILAPALGQGIVLFGTWRWVFLVLLLVSLTGLAWSGLRLPETRAPDAPRFTVAAAFRLVMGTRITLGYMIAAGFMFGCLVSYIASAQQIFAGSYSLGKLFPLAFGGVACAMAAASFTNSRLVQKLGMRRLSHTALTGFLIVSAVLAIIAYLGKPPLAVTLGGLGLCFFLYGMVLSNFNAIAMQPVGQAAGMAASLIGAYTTATGALFGTVVARQFADGPLALLTGFALLAFCALLTVFLTEGQNGLFRGE